MTHSLFQRYGGGLLAASVALLASVAAALGPHEILLLVNDRSPRSKQLANHFARLRQVPSQNIVYLPLPDAVLEAPAEMSPEDFTRWIWEPANAAARERGIDDHILAWVYSADFPVRITTTPAISVQGLTFTRNAMVDAQAVKTGQYLSPLYAGPDKPQGPRALAQSLDRAKDRLQANMPLPSMMLAVLGSRGQDMDNALHVLSRGALADRASPRGTVYYVVNDDVRSRCRDWQFKEAQAELMKEGVSSVITSNFPSQRSDVLGVLSGLCWPKPSEVAAFTPGCIADHLTSFAGVLDYFDHGKLTEWLRAGAIASSGAVTEPYALWAKFPNGRLFAHYASGCTVMESFFLSVRCPLQLLIVGEPLCSPWAPKASLVLIRVDEGDAADKAVFHAELFPPAPGAASPDIHYYVDGRSGPVGGCEVDLPTSRLADGYHELRAVAYSANAVRQQVFATCGFEVRRKHRAVTLGGIDGKGRVCDGFRPLSLTVTATGTPVIFSLLGGDRIVG